MEPIDIWEETFKKYYITVDPATNYYTFEYGKFKFYQSGAEDREEKIPTLNESRLKEIKP
jgi:hypothetical protein